MIVKSVKQAPIFSEFTREEQECYFSLSDRKVTNHVDIMYYSCTILGDSNQNENVAALLTDLCDLKKRKSECYSSKAYTYGSYVTGVLLGRIEWYLEFGHNETIREELENAYNGFFTDVIHFEKRENRFKSRSIFLGIDGDAGHCSGTGDDS